MKLVFWIAVIAVLAFILTRYVERHNLYFPMKELEGDPGLIGLPFEEAYFETSDNVRLYGWFLPASGAKYTVIFCHGNAGNISHRLEKIAILHNLGLSVFIFDYRGYGKSEGAPSEQGLYRDADAACAYLVERRGIPEGRIILYGESLGGGVAIHAAQNRGLKAVITEEAFSSVRDMAGLVYPFIPRFMVANKFDSLSKIKNVTCPKLIIHSTNDEIVPFSLGERLYNAASPPKKLHKIRGSHNTAFLDSEEEYKEGLKSFLSNLP